MTTAYSMEKATRVGTHRSNYLILDRDLRILVPVRDWVLGMEAAGLAENTERAYVRSVETFLNYCAATGIDWKKIRLRELVLFRRALEGSITRYGKPPHPNTVSNTITAVHSFLTFCAGDGVITKEVHAGISSESKNLIYLRRDQDPGENGQNRRVGPANALKVQRERRPPEALTEAELRDVLSVARNPRDIFMVTLLLDTGLRIGEAIGLHRPDLHFLSNSRSLNCHVEGPHLHVHRRINENGAYAKSVVSRSVPVTEDVISTYRDYQWERDRRVPESSSEFVLLNLYDVQARRDTPLKYRNAKRCFERLAKNSGVEVRPHMLRHTYITDLGEAGTDLSTMADLAGHASLSSTAGYRHTTDKNKRAAVSGLEAARKKARR